MPSQGLGPRRSVLPLLISFLFSHIVLAERSLPLPLALPIAVIAVSPFPRSFLFPSLPFPFFLFLRPRPRPVALPTLPPPRPPPPSRSAAIRLPLYLSTLAAYLAAWESARAIRAAREEVLIPVSCFSTLLLSLSLSLSLESS